MKSEKLIYIIILNWNGFEDTMECIESIKKINYSNYKIILVDNGSQIKEYRRLKSYYHNDQLVNVIRNKINLGFAGGVNIGIKRSLKDKADYSLLLNNDTIVEKNFLKELVNFAIKSKKIGILSSKIFYYDEPNRVWFNGIKFNYYFPPLSTKLNVTKPTEINEVVGCAMLIKNEIFTKIGLFDEDYFAYSEEDDFNYRVNKLTDYKLYIIPSSIVWHKISRSTGGGFNKIVAYLKMRNKIKFARKNYPFKYKPTYLIFLILYFTKEQFKAIIAGKFDITIALLRGVKDSFSKVNLNF